jgi:REP element-mobilizing transposase RayT
MSDPIAYLITFRTYGTWLHGDQRGSTDDTHNIYGTPMLEPHRGRRRSAEQRLTHPPTNLTDLQRNTVQLAIEHVATRRDWTIHALNVRSNHVHVVVSAPLPPEAVMHAFKSWATRRLRESKRVDKNARVWSRHGSTKYIWKQHQLVASRRYVTDHQGADL